jgi:predicted nuclease of predicted toxin-antitoxin system
VRILANENFPRVAISALIARGHDLVWIRLVAPGISDQDVLARAQADGRVLTFDKDFGELAFRYGLPSNCGVVLFRIAAPSPQRVADVTGRSLFGCGRRTDKNDSATITTF